MARAGDSVAGGFLSSWSLPPRLGVSAPARGAEDSWTNALAEGTLTLRSLVPMKTSVASAFSVCRARRHHGGQRLRLLPASTKGSGVDPGTGDDGGSASSSGGFQNEDSGGDPPEESCAAGTGLHVPDRPLHGDDADHHHRPGVRPGKARTRSTTCRCTCRSKAPTTPFSQGPRAGAAPTSTRCRWRARSPTRAAPSPSRRPRAARTSLPLIVQVGKWRMIYKLPTVTKCTTNEAGTILNTTLRLPRNHKQGRHPQHRHLDGRSRLALSAC